MVNKYISDQYSDILAEFITKIDSLKTELSDMGYVLVGDEPLKLTVVCKSYGYSGYEFSNILLHQNIVCEFADPDYVVMMLTPEIGDSGLERLKTVLSQIKAKESITSFSPIPMPKKRKLSLKEALFSSSLNLRAEDCIGKISASADVACPPAVPIVIPGEEIDNNTIECFKYYGIKSVWLLTTLFNHS